MFIRTVLSTLAVHTLAVHSPSGDQERRRKKEAIPSSWNRPWRETVAGGGGGGPEAAAEEDGGGTAGRGAVTGVVSGGGAPVGGDVRPGAGAGAGAAAVAAASGVNEAAAGPF